MKKFLLIFIALACVISVAACAAGIEPIQAKAYKAAAEKHAAYDALASSSATYRLGDVNKDGEISNADILVIYRHIYNSTAYPLENESDPSAFTLADVNKDGKISNLDVLMFYRHIYNPELYPFEDETEEEATTEKSEETTKPFMGPSVPM